MMSTTDGTQDPEGTVFCEIEAPLGYCKASNITPVDYTNFFPLEGVIVEASNNVSSTSKFSHIMITLAILETYFDHFLSKNNYA